MSKKNPIQRVEIFRWKTESNYAILITRKHSVKVYQSVRRSRAQSVENACTSTYDGNNRRFANTPSSVCAVYRFDPKPKTQPLTVYFVQVGMDGYLPDSVSAYPTLAQAIRAAKEEKRVTLDCWGCSESTIKITGNIRTDWAYEVLLDGEYHTLIRISADSDPSIHALDTKFFPLTRANLAEFCDWYNQNN